jgi:signal transduction histidine kinase
MDNFPASAAILNESGIILNVNEAWRLFAGEHCLADRGYGVGRKYLDICQVMFDWESMEALMAKLSQVMKKEQVEASLEFSCSANSKRHWYRICVSRLDPPDSKQTFRVLIVQQDITRQKQAEERLQELSGRLINTQEQERHRIARELHDDLNQQLAVLSIELEQLGQNFPRSSAEHRLRMRNLMTRVRDISTEVRRLSHQLHPSKLDTLGLVPAVNSLCQEISEHQVLHVEFSHQSVPRSISKDVAVCLYRIAQEALRNAIKHSGARTAKVQLTGSPAEIRLSISDTGAGFDIENGRERGGLGLISMQERLRLIGGELTVESQAGRGTRIDARVPRMENGE